MGAGHDQEVDMFRDARAFTSFSVDDIATARDFYGDVLGLPVEEIAGMGILAVTLGGGGTVMLYPKDDHVPATFTVLNFSVDDLDAAVDGLTGQGITMLRYPEIAEPDERGIHGGQGPRIAWFTDPAGNILSVMTEQAG
jgi:predicted enzyme related to lactoylglutathione lyase